MANYLSRNDLEYQSDYSDAPAGHVPFDETVMMAPAAFDYNVTI